MTRPGFRNEYHSDARHVEDSKLSEEIAEFLREIWWTARLELASSALRTLSAGTSHDLAVSWRTS